MTQTPTPRREPRTKDEVGALRKSWAEIIGGRAVPPFTTPLVSADLAKELTMTRELRTESAKALRLLLNEADIHWPDDMTRLAADVLTPQILAIEDEACDEYKEATDAAMNYGDGYRQALSELEEEIGGLQGLHENYHPQLRAGFERARAVVIELIHKKGTGK